VDKSALSKKAVKTESLIFRINNTYLPPWSGSAKSQYSQTGFRCAIGILLKSVL
jgi:hypothetical protein